MRSREKVGDGSNDPGVVAVTNFCSGLTSCSCHKIDIPYAASEDELSYHLGLNNFTTGKGKVNLTDSNVRPLEVFMCSIVRKMGYGDGFKWMSQYIK